MKLVIPEYKTLELDTIFLDMNGTIAVDGVIPPSVKERLIALSEQFRIYVLTAKFSIIFHFQKSVSFLTKPEYDKGPQSTGIPGMTAGLYPAFFTLHSG